MCRMSLYPKQFGDHPISPRELKIKNGVIARKMGYFPNLIYDN